MTNLACRATAALSSSGVERAEPNGPPTAFRIWRAGDNTTDHGPTIFTKRSASRLLEQQARRSNKFSIDVNHASLHPDAPIENQRAVGFFNIEVRDGELWATNVDWVKSWGEAVARGEWRYHSPAYDIDPKTKEVIGLTNLAITNNPATWGVTDIAATRIAATRPTSIPSDILRLTATQCPDRGLARRAATELERRGERVSNDPALERLRAMAGRGSRPIVRNEGCKQIFPVMTPAEARAMHNAPKRVTASMLPPAQKAALDERMGISPSATIERDGVHQVFPVMTSEEARAFAASRPSR